jgi:protein-disulfide isomerase
MEKSSRRRGERVEIVTTFILGFWLLAVAAAQAQPLDEVLAALGNDRTIGSNGAAVSIVEFSDFQCSFCRKFWADTLPKLKESYIKQNQARFSYRHFAILGNFSVQSAMAAECAAEQGKFWDYHDRLFANQRGLGFTASNLERYGREVGLNADQFRRCLASEKFRKKVEGETAVAASLGGRGTPTFFVNRRLMVGAQPFEAFRSVIEQALQARGAKHKDN